MSERTLAGWLKDQIGPGKRFRSAREMAIAAGLNQNTLLYIIAKDRAEPETLVKIAEIVGLDPIELFVLAGWLERAPETTEDGSLLRKWRRLSLAQRQAIMGVIDTFLAH